MKFQSLMNAPRFLPSLLRSTTTCRLVLNAARGVAVVFALGQLAGLLPAKPVTILPLGASITEGGGNRASYRMPLWELLVGYGYVVEFVGSRSSSERIGPLRHEGHSGSPAEYLAKHIVELYQANPADVVLLHAGHNHSTEEHPVGGIVEATRQIVAKVRAINPKVIVLVAQPAPKGKLPKYDYLPELNRALADFAQEDRVAHAHDAIHPVVLVDQTVGFDWHTDTIADHVHPNPAGTRKIARRWFAALQKILPPPEQVVPEPERIVYKHFDGRELTLSVFRPEAPARRQDPAPAVVYFFGGGWHLGTPVQFYRECGRLAVRGMVAISADYRIDATSHSTPFDSVADAKSAIRWIRAHAGELGIDPDRIAAAGASAGGQLAAAAAFVPGCDDAADDLKVSCRPDALVLLYPVLDTGMERYRPRLGGRGLDISPLQHVSAPVPPMVLFVGEQDPVVPPGTVERFQSRVAAVGGHCRLFVYPNEGHPLWSYRSGENEVSRDVTAKTEAFFGELGWIDQAAR
jgi:acetyl esterase/lipase